MTKCIFQETEKRTTVATRGLQQSSTPLNKRNGVKSITFSSFKASWLSPKGFCTPVRLAWWLHIFAAITFSSTLQRMKPQDVGVMAMATNDLTSYICLGFIWFILFYGISTPYRLSNAEFLSFCKCFLIVKIIYRFSLVWFISLTAYRRLMSKLGSFTNIWFGLFIQRHIDTRGIT